MGSIPDWTLEITDMRKLTHTTVLAALLASATLLVAPAAAQEDGSFPAARRDNPDNDNFFKLRARLYADAAFIDWNGADLEETELRTARLGFEGRWFDWAYKAEFDFAGDDVTAKGIELTYRSDGYSLTVGNLKTTNSLAEQTSSRYSTFMERGTATDLFGLDRRIGGIFRTGGDNYSFAAGVFGGRLDDLSDGLDTDDTSAASARLTFTPVNDDNLVLHFGGSIRTLEYGDSGTRVRARPRFHTTDRIVTADFRPGKPLGQADSSTLFGLEAAFVSGPFHGHAEYMTLDVDGPAGDPGFDSAFVNFGWFLTGETRSYRASSGAFRRTSPANPVSEGGMGAFELAVRYDTSDLNDVAAGDLTSWTLGLNWYVESHVRVMANVIDAELSVPGAPDIDVSGVQFRAQWDF
jgi:phosphate-selective porin OprO/OprP